eukprot:TRINITY_DN8683_c0_g1_i1.p1 TRINITY_DN8683_c0_g1~~TRINITY_DN8683_c0_g1_i1.p1  ORF type:complete len:273 (+),score=64.16 TRINITY_DN8683_c0_g1_i1:72-890(+)
MKINVASPSSGTQKVFEVDDERKLLQLYEKRMSQEFPGEIVGDQFKGYTLRITGGQDKQGFPMKQGVLSNARVHLLLSSGVVGLQSWRVRNGERRRKSIRGCIVGPDIAILNCVIVTEGEAKVEGLNDHVVPRKLGPKRASHIRKLFNLTKEDDVRKFVIRRYLKATEKKKAISKAPKIQRLVTPVTLERKRRKACAVRQRRLKSKEERAAYQNLLDRRRVVSAQRKRCRLLKAQSAQKRTELKREFLAKRAAAKVQPAKKAAKAAGSKKKK